MALFISYLIVSLDGRECTTCGLHQTSQAANSASSTNIEYPVTPSGFVWRLEQQDKAACSILLERSGYVFSMFQTSEPCSRLGPDQFFVEH
jgi:hypothetical protein